MVRRLLIASQPLDAGVPHHVLDLVGSLDTARYELHVACPRASVLWERLEGRSDLRLHAIARQRRPSPADAGSFARLLRLVHQADVVHAHSAKAGFLTRLAAAARGRRASTVFTPHGWSFWAASGGEAMAYRALERAAARWCHAIIALSEYERDAGLEAGVGEAAQYRVIPNGVDLERFGGDPEPVPGRILMVGRLAAPKRHDLVVKAMVEVGRRRPEAELYLVGDGPLRAEIDELVRGLGLQGRVHLLGSRDDVPQLLSQADCVVLSSDYEGCPLSVIEAMAAGVPVVASRLGGLPEIIENGVTGLLVEHDRPELLADALEELFADQDRARRLGEAGRKVAATRFSRERMVAETFALYEEVAESAG